MSSTKLFHPDTIYEWVKISSIIINSLSILVNQNTATEREYVDRLVCTQNISYGEVNSRNTQLEKQVNIGQEDDDYYI